MAISDLDKRVEDSLANAMAKSRGGAKPTPPLVPEPEPVVPTVEFKDSVKGSKFSKVFGMAPPAGMPELKCKVYKHTDWDKGDRKFIPDRASFDNYVPNVQLLYQLWVSVLRNNKKALVVGPTGSGKTSLQEFFCAYINQPLYRINGRGDMESDSILGRPVVSMVRR